MTVKELREALSRLEDDLEVKTEGCDCYGDAKGVETYTTDDGRQVVLITRYM